MDFAIQNKLSAADIKFMRQKLDLKQKDLAALVNVSVKTVERWEQGTTEISGPIVTLFKIFNEEPELVKKLQIPAQEFPVRLFYYYKKTLCTIIDVDEPTRSVEIKNFSQSPVYCAFGVNESPTFKDYEEFLESRCFPRSRDKMKIILRDLPQQADHFLWSNHDAASVRINGVEKSADGFKITHRGFTVLKLCDLFIPRLYRGGKFVSV